MKNASRIISIFTVIIMIFCFSGCKSSNSFVLNSSDEHYSIAGDDTEERVVDDNGNTTTIVQNTTKTKKQKGNNSGTSSYEKLDLHNSDGFMEMQIPSRKNAYKLTNLYNKIKKGDSVNVVYFGGSVTGGTGSSDSYSKSWRALTTSFLKSVFKAKIVETNAALGGTGSYLGAARFEHDVLAKNPDLLFIEFAINDKYSGLSTTQSKMDLEYMIRKLYEKNPYADIVLVLVTNDTYYGMDFPSYIAHKEVADYYNIPIVDLGGELYNQLKGSRAEFKKYFSDSVHPNDAGYKLYGNIMTKALKELVIAGSTSKHKNPASKLCKNGFSTLTNIQASSISAPGWDLKSWFDNKTYEKDGSQFRYSGNLKSIFPKYLAPKAIENKITYNFTGNSFGILGTIKDNVSLVVSLDSSKEVELKGVAKAEMLEYPAFENLTNGAHTVTVTVYGSTPHAAIAAFVTTKQ